jgi:hypothetical protein
LQLDPRSFGFLTDIPLSLRKTPWKERGPRNAALGRPAGAAPAKFRPGRRRAGRGRVRGGVGGVLGPIGGWDGRRGERRWPPAVQPEGDRGGARSGEVRARSGLRAAGEASVGARSPVGVLKLWRPRADRELDGGGVDGVAGAGSSAWRGGSGASRKEQRPPFKAAHVLACDRGADGDVPWGGRRPR